MYNNSQYPASGYSGYPQYQQGYGDYNYQGYGQTYSTTPASDVTQPAPPGEGFTTNNWTTTTPATSTYSANKTDAVAKEMEQQKAQLTKQREEYVRKVSVLRKELDQLRLQKTQLMGSNRSSDKDLANILKENDKLQSEIQGKMKAIQNVIEMLSSIIKDGKSVADLEASLNEEAHVVETAKSSTPEKSRSSYSHSHKSMTPEVTHHRDSRGDQQRAKSRGRSKSRGRTRSPERVCYVHYDTGLHWCRLCDEFPETAKDFLLHLQEKDHREMVKENDVDLTPWHKLAAEELLPSDENAPKKRVPIKGLQFFISAPSWYCKLCDVWIGDLHCASHHLKSVSHFQNYENFVSQNPHWEMEWLKDRELAMSRKGANSSDSDDSKKRRKRKFSHDVASSKDKKKKKRSKRKRKDSTDSSSSSSSSDSSSDSNTDTSKSIRVAMRNMKQVQSIMNEDLSSRWSVLEKLVEEHKKKEERDRRERESEEKDDTLINQWMTVSQPPEKDKKLLESLKDRMKQKQVVERAKMAELELKKLEREKRERELEERKQREIREAAEAAERELRRREEEEADRIRNRDQVRFKTNYRRRRSPSQNKSDEDEYDKHRRNNRHRKDSDNRSSHDKHRSRSRSKSPPKPTEQKSENNHTENKKKPPGPPSYKKLPFIGRMPLFKNKKTAAEKAEEDKGTKEIQKESYDQPRRTRFQPGNLAKAFIPKPDVVCFPKLSSIPPLNLPPPPPTVAQSKMEEMVPKPPAPPTISKEEKSSPEAPPPPKIEGKTEKNLSDDEVLYGESGDAMNPSSMGQYYQDYNMMSYQQYQPPSFSKDHMEAPPPPANAYTMPLQPPPLPPDDDLAMLGICADDMAAQSF
ncbi:unnamed protein product [Callosobruchus maculatus]|uniref:U1-type domain-containing protein n=1 Tax=Callosobruchus maculatus TaxID=64391 RepID=A0A653BMU0_CALMS|nr:unnamed protein product [Callosobruchus maculatus]